MSEREEKIHTDVVEKVLVSQMLAIIDKYEHVDTYNLIFLSKKCSSDAVYWCISPTLD